MRKSILGAMAAALMHIPGLQQTLSLVTEFKAPVVIGAGRANPHKRIFRGPENLNGRYLNAAYAARAMRRYDRFVRKYQDRKVPQWMRANAELAIKQFRGR